MYCALLSVKKCLYFSDSWQQSFGLISGWLNLVVFFRELYDLYRVVQNCKPLANDISKSYWNLPIKLDFESNLSVKEA